MQSAFKMQTQEPLDAASFAASMQALGLESARVIAAAVSGGGDSMALAILLHSWARANDSRLIAFTVDHALRPESTQEAKETSARLQNLGIEHEILTWEGAKPATHIQERARQARYALLHAACRRHNCGILALAHNAEDQMETFWMRLAAGSGPDGLAAMAPKRMQDNILHVRPLLSFTRMQLRDVCRSQRIEWIEDPSNNNEQFLRVRLRAFEELLTQEGLSPGRLSRILQKMGDARAALDWAARRAAERSLCIQPEGYITLDLETWKELPVDLQRRVLTLAITRFAPDDVYAPAFDAIEETRRALLSPGFSGKTLAGCDISLLAPNKVLIAREEAGAEKTISLHEGAVWDGRFIFHGWGESFQAGPIQNPGFEKLRKQDDIAAAKASVIPLKARRTLAGVYSAGELVSIPQLGYYAPECPMTAKTGKVLLSPRFGAKFS